MPTFYWVSLHLAAVQNCGAWKCAQMDADYTNIIYAQCKFLYRTKIAEVVIPSKCLPIKPQFCPQGNSGHLAAWLQLPATDDSQGI